MENIFTVSLPSGKTQKGLFFDAESPKMNLLILTGMGEYAGRYEDFAKYLNGFGINVRVLDAVAQGLNAPKVEYQERWHEGAFDENVLAASLAIEEMKKNELPTCIMGHSMGSFMAQEYIQRFHERANKVVLCGTDYANPFVMNFAYQLSRMLVPAHKRNVPNKTLAGLVTGNFAKAVKNRKTDFDWLSYNKENVDKYIADPKCGFVATGGFYRDFLKGMRRIGKTKFIHKIRPTVSIFIIAGKEDPVGHMGKGPKKLYKKYQRLGVSNVSLKLYDHMRHEILNEKNKQEVIDDVINFYNE